MSQPRRSSTGRWSFALSWAAIGSALWWIGVTVGWAVLGCFIGLLALSASTRAQCVSLGQVSLCTSAFGHSWVT